VHLAAINPEPYSSKAASGEAREGRAPGRSSERGARGSGSGRGAANGVAADAGGRRPAEAAGGGGGRGDGSGRGAGRGDRGGRSGGRGAGRGGTAANGGRGGAPSAADATAAAPAAAADGAAGAQAGGGGAAGAPRPAPLVTPTGPVMAGGYFMSPTGQVVYYPPVAFNVPNAVSPDALKDSVRRQVEYYFSAENLTRDFFLRGKMDTEGWIEVHLIAGFNRVRMLTPDPAVIVDALLGSATVEISPDGSRMRAREGPLQWVLAGAAPAAKPAAAAKGGESAAAAKEAAAPAAAPVAAAPAAEAPAAADAAAVAPSTPAPVPPAAAAAAPASPAAGNGAADADADGDADGEEDDLFEMDEEREGAAAAAPPARGGGGGARKHLSDRELEKLIVVTPGKRAPGFPRGALEPEMDKLIDDGLALYQRELRGDAGRSDVAAAAGVAAGKGAKGATEGGEKEAGGGGAGSGGAAPHAAARPPRASRDGRDPSGSWRDASAPKHFYSASLPRSTGRRYGAPAMGTSPMSSHVGWLMGATPPNGNSFLASPPLGGSLGRHVYGSSPRSGGGGGGGGGDHSLGASLPISKFQHPSHSLLEEGGFKQIRYVKYYKRCIEDRAAKGGCLGPRRALGMGCVNTGASRGCCPSARFARRQPPRGRPRHARTH
jgi:hypothetical protein